MSDIRVAFRGYKGPEKVFEEAATIPDEGEEQIGEAAGRYAEKHCSAMDSDAIDMIEIEFLDEPDVNQRFVRFGVNPAGMVNPAPFLPMWVVYENPSDYPGKFVVRQSMVMADGSGSVAERPVVVADSLELARAEIPQGAHRMNRFLDDEPQVVEVWI